MKATVRTKKPRSVGTLGGIRKPDGYGHLSTLRTIETVQLSGFSLLEKLNMTGKPVLLQGIP
jgi:hypothetical protein